MESLRDRLDRERAADDVLLIRDQLPDCAQALFVRGTGMQSLTVIDERIDCQARVNELDAHETGHHRNTLQDIFKGAPHDMFSMTPALAERIEVLADREAASIAVSPERIIEAFAEGCREPWEFAEVLEITEKKFVAWIELQQHRYGTRAFDHMGYCMTFVPMRIELAG